MSVENKSFKERIKNIAITESKNFKNIFVDYEYLVCSPIFTNKDFYIISAYEDNYQHLIGVNSSLNAKDFFNKCYDGTLQETDFDFKKKGQKEKDVKGTVRRKIQVLGNMMSLFKSTFYVQENFRKNTVLCSFATSDNKCTIGFIDIGKKSIPKSLLKGNELDEEKKASVDLIIRKKKLEQKFNELVVGNFEIIKKYYHNIGEIIDESALSDSDAIEALKEIASDNKLC